MLGLLRRLETVARINKLERRPLHPDLRYVLDQVDANGVFIDKCSEVLGYSDLLKIDRVFKAVGIEPFTSKSVDDYMFAEAKKYVKSHYHIRHKNIARIVDNETFYGGWPDLYELYRKEGWQAISLREYKDRVPESALQHALQINELLPDANFTVVEFKPKDVNARVVEDPFLRLDYQGCEIYFDVWNEPGFTAKLTGT